MQEHGQFNVTLNGNIIYVTFIGMFNDIASQHLCNEVETIVSNMNGAQFCMLYNLVEYEGSTPEAHIIGNEHFKWLEQQNCLGKATVTTNTALVEISRLQQNSLRQSTLKTQLFKNEADALTWLLLLLE